jgi:hypothetical protein
MIDLFESWTVDNYLSLISIVLVVIGGVFALAQWRIEIKTKRANFLEQINLKINADQEMVETMHLIDYNNEWYGKNFHENKTVECPIDKLFSYFNYICYLRKVKNITEKEFVIFHYKIKRIFVSQCAKSYLWNLYHFSEQNKAQCSFQYLIDYGIEINAIIASEFKDSKNNKYKKYLNF